jgi:hypothetical protein
MKSTYSESNSELSINSELLSLLDVETMLTKSVETEERHHRKVLALSFVQMAITALDEDQGGAGRIGLMAVTPSPVVDS